MSVAEALWLPRPPPSAQEGSREQLTSMAPWVSSASTWLHLLVLSKRIRWHTKSGRAFS